MSRNPRPTKNRARRRQRADARQQERARTEHELRRVRKARVVSFVMLPVLVFVIWTMCADWWEHRDDHLLPRVEGTIESAEPVSRLFITRPELSIRVEGREELVRARLSLDTAEDFADRPVAFYFDGDTAREVRLIGETEPWWIVGLLLFLGVSMIVGIPIGQRLLERKLDRLDTEEAGDRAAAEPIADVSGVRQPD